MGAIKLTDHLPLGDCFLCQRSMQAMICKTCQAQLPKIGPCCQLCAEPLPDGESSAHCGNCLQNPPPWEKLIVPWRYENTIQQLIHRIKFYGAPHLAAELGALLGTHIKQMKQATPIDCLIPVPLHRGRLAKRSYNQAEWIARACGKILNIPVDTKILVRKKRTKAQATLNSAEIRTKNMLNAFQLKKDPGYHRVAVIDDVYTTGSTLRACLSAWGKNNPTHLLAWCLAKS